VAIEPGTKLQDRYEILNELGRGGMGSVFKAHDPLLDRIVAIKTLSAALSADESFIRRFRHEARAVARLNHPGIVGIFDVGQEGAVSFIVMEYIAGGSLADLLKRETRLPPLRVVQLLEQVATALDFAHGRGFVHRDIKPANVLLDDHDRTRLTDFGLVKFEDISLTLPGQMMGTPTYMAPEQITGEDVGGATDIYALGVVAYEMLTGAPPFTGAMATVFDGHIRRDPPPPQTLNPNLPPDLEPILRQTLAKNPADRFDTAADFVATLRQFFTASSPPVFGPQVSSPAAGAKPASVPPSGGYPASGGLVQPSQPPPLTEAAPPPAPKKSNFLTIFGGLTGLLFLCFCLAVSLYWAGSRLGGDETTAVAQATATTAPAIDLPAIPLAGNEETATAEPETELPATSLADVRRSVVQIEAQGSFVDPQFGLQLNQAGRGSGFVIAADGLAVTNNHVVTGAGLLRVYVEGESRPRSARVLGVSECYDLAVIQIDGQPLPPLVWYEGAVAVAQTVHAAGFPLGQTEFSLTSGAVVATEATGITDWAALDYVIAHDAPISPGNSGGPLVDDDGRLLGVNYASAAAQNQYFAIGREQALPIIERLRQGQDVYAIGINGVAVNDGAGLAGIWVSSVKAGSPADRAGILPGDVITMMQGLLLATDGTMDDYCAVLRSHGPDDTLSIEVRRLETEEILVGQINGRVLETKTLLSTLDQAVSSSGDSYSGYQDFVDAAEVISLALPVEWRDINEGAWNIDDETVGLSMAAAANLEAFYATWTEPGIFLGASRLLASDFDENSFLDAFDFSTDCTYDTRYTYSDPLYTGVYDLWLNCDGSDTAFFVLAAVPEDGAFLILIQVVLVTDADLEALGQILDTFVVAPTLP